MDTVIRRHMGADRQTVFRLAAAVEDWPRILPHYRWVRILARYPDGRRRVSMGARRDVAAGLAVPLRWIAIQTVDERAYRIRFEHVHGITQGMHVEWSIEPDPTRAGLAVEIRHVFAPRWPVHDALIRLVVGEYFVNGVARRTLRRIGELAEGPLAGFGGTKQA